jgi:ATP phosphoribosyltransferase
MALPMKDRSDEIVSAPPVLRLAIPSDGEMYEPTLKFLENCGMRVHRPSSRRYTATIPSIPGVDVVFQRTADITTQVEQGNAFLGIVAFDRYREYRTDSTDTRVIINHLGFGRCDLVLAVPDSWVDVTSMADLADVAIELQGLGRKLRVATKYPRLVQAFLLGSEINYFTLVPVSGTLEAAPAMGYADAIVDISSSGVTLRENHLRRLDDGIILSSEGCLIANLVTLKKTSGALAIAKEIIERIDAFQAAIDTVRVSADVKGSSEEEVASVLVKENLASGLMGPTISRVFARDGAELLERWYTVTIFASRSNLSRLVDYLRTVGASSVAVSKLEYVFKAKSASFTDLVDSLRSYDGNQRTPR